MANSCYIKNKKKESVKETLALLKGEFLKKFNIEVETSSKQMDGYTYCEILYKGISISFFYESTRFEFYDTPSTALDRSETSKKLKEMFYRHSGFYFGHTSAYAYLYEYVKYFLSKHHGVKLDSDGIGPYKPTNVHKYNSLNSWLDYYQETMKKDGLFQKALRLAIAPTMNKIKSEEMDKFPELF